MFKNIKPIVFMTVLVLLFVFSNGAVVLSLLRVDSKSDVAETSSVKVGSAIAFGRYFKNNDRELETLRWRVLAVDGSKVLLITENCIEIEPYHHRQKNVDWEHSDIREWLNNDFIDTVFKLSEQKELLVTNNVSHTGSITKDTIFLLSVEEAKKYFRSDEDRRCEVTPYVKIKGAYVYQDNALYGWWWLRLSGSNGNGVAYVRGDGRIRGYGGSTYGTYASVRPALWLNLQIFNQP